jgi:hypothetical protein
MDCLFWHGPRVTYDSLWVRRRTIPPSSFLLLHPVEKNQRVGMFRRLWVCGRRTDCSFMDRAFRARRDPWIGCHRGGAWGGGLPGSAVDARVWSGGSNARVAPLHQARLPLGVGRKSSRRAAATRAVELSPNLVPSSTALGDQGCDTRVSPGALSDLHANNDACCLAFTM